MKLPVESLSVQEQMAEFDQWLTARLERIKDTDKFATEMNSLCDCIHHLSPFLNDFRTAEDCQVQNLCQAVIDASKSFVSGMDFYQDEINLSRFYESFFNLIFLTSGATDNNLKNHFLIKLKEDDIEPLIPRRGSGKKTIKFTLTKVNSTTKSEIVAKLLASCFVGTQESYVQKVKTIPTFDLSFYLNLYLREYTAMILEDREEVMQFWAICSSYMKLSNMSHEIDFGRYLLNSCTIFKVRGSVSASGGHLPEQILRDKFLIMGLQSEKDFNSIDVNVGNEIVVEGGKRKKKTRAYDFIIPYQIEEWGAKPKLFIQSQFYAGDSGSVSHKVVDQTRSSRDFTRSKYPNSLFVEYLDGAGYYAALRTDLEHMLSFDDTASFFQVKSILIRLRREFQNIAFLTPIEFEHAILMVENASKQEVHTFLQSEGYPDDEIKRAESVYIELGYIQINQDGQYFLSSQRIPIARRLMILDLAAQYSVQITDDERYTEKFLLIPGYGVNQAILESELCKRVCEAIKAINVSAVDFSEDIEWLLDERVIKRK